MGTAIKHPVPDRVKSVIICNFCHPGTLTLSPERESARMSKITNDGLTRSGSQQQRQVITSNMRQKIKVSITIILLCYYFLI